MSYHTLIISRSKWAGFFLGALFLFPLLITNGFAADLDAGRESDYQARFEEGAGYFLSGNYLSAAYVFEKLYADTQSQRVKLEWARTLFYLGQSEQAEALFKEVLATNPPLPVREKINTFLEDIAISKGKFDYVFGMVRDTNPRAIPTNRTINIFGMSLNYTPQFDTSPQYGMSYRFMASKSLDNQNRMVGSVSMYGIKFGTTYFDRNSIEAKLAYRLNETPRIQTQLGIERMYYAGDHLYDYPWVSISHSLENASGAYWTNEIKAGRLTYPVYSYLNGTLSSYTTSVAKSVSPQANVGVELYVDRSNAVESAYAYGTNMISLFSNVYQANGGIKAQIRVSSSSKKYDSADPFFGEVRSDNRNMVMLTLSKNDLNILGLTPIVDLGYEKTNSNISFYSFSKMTTNISFKKAY